MFPIPRLPEREVSVLAGKARMAPSARVPGARGYRPAGRGFKGAHVRIGASAAGRINPRLYFRDATARFGMMYVGYLGRHLSNTRS